MKIICSEALAKLASSAPYEEEYKAKWKEAFLGDFEQSYVYKTMKGTEGVGHDEDKRVSIIHWSVLHIAESQF